jgi:hypothetical protein
MKNKNFAFAGLGVIIVGLLVGLIITLSTIHGKDQYIETLESDLKTSQAETAQALEELEASEKNLDLANTCLGGLEGPLNDFHNGLLNIDLSRSALVEGFQNIFTYSDEEMTALGDLQVQSYDDGWVLYADAYDALDTLSCVEITQDNFFDVASIR